MVSFGPHVDLLALFLARRRTIVDAIESVLGAGRRPDAQWQDRARISRSIEDSFFRCAGMTPELAGLRGELEEMHHASGFSPRRTSAVFNDLIDAGEMAARGVHCWRQTRWPGRPARQRYAETLFDCYLIRQLALASMRVFDDPPDAGARLERLQRLLDELWRGAPDDRPRLVRDARWLIPLAQSPTTDELGAYFDVAENVAGRLGEADRLEVHKASVTMISGHLRSQIRHYCQQGELSLDDPSVVRRTRTSNALDFALLIQALVPLLAAYEAASRTGDDAGRLGLAEAICQGVSPDPELFVNRPELLAPYSTIDYLFAATGDDGGAVLTAPGRRHLGLFGRYTALVGRTAERLLEDCARFRPAAGAYSPYGAIYGTPSNLVEDMALKTLDRDAEAGFGLEDAFTAGGADKLAWVDGWRDLPHVPPGVRDAYRYPVEFAARIFARIENALRARVAGGDARAAAEPVGRLFVAAEGEDDSFAATVPQLPARYIVASDPKLVSTQRAEPYDDARLLRDGREGYFLVCYATDDGRVGVRKDLLTELLGVGRDARIRGLPAEVAGRLAIVCPGLVVRAGDQASVPPSMLNA